MNNEWKTVKLGEVVKIKGGKRLPKGISLIKKRNLHPYIRVKDMNGGKVVKLTTEFEYVDDETQKQIARYIVEEGDIIISIVGTVGLVSIVHKSLNGANLTENCVKLVDIQGVDVNYIYYFLTSREGQNEIKKGIVGSTQPKLPIYNIEKIELPQPPLEEQKAIAYILSTIDEKIDTNNKMNKKLEEMAQTIFKHWFVDFEFPNDDGEPYKSSGGEMIESELGLIPKGWEVGKFEDLVTVKYGKDHKKLENGNIPVYGSGGVIRYVNKSLYSSESVLIPRKGTLNNVIYMNEPFWSVDTMFFTQMNFPDIAKYIYFFISDKDLLSMNSGSAVPSMTTDILNKLPIIVSPLTIIQNFNKLVEPIFMHMNLNNKQTEKLSQLRDLLLPKLMSGEIRVPLEEGDIS